MLYLIFRSIAILVCKILFKLRVVGKKNIPRKGGFILASNHLSYLDPIVLGVASPRKLNFMARHDLFYHPFFSWLISTLGAFPIKRSSPDLSGLKEAMYRVKNGNGLVVFPEGSRGVNGIFDRPLSGIGFLVTKLDIPVIPAFIKGSDSVLPRNAKFIKPHQISVYFGKQISIERRLSYQDITKEIMISIKHLSC